MLYYNVKYRGFQLVNMARETAVEYCPHLRDSDHFLDYVVYTTDAFEFFQRDLKRKETNILSRIPTEFIRGERQV